MLFTLFSAFLTVSVTHAEIEKPKPAIVFAKLIQKTELFESLSYPARIDSRVNTQLLAETDGIVSKIFVTLGEKVRAHRQLLSVSHTDPVYQYAPVLLRSPVQGVVSEVAVTEGTQVTKGQRLASVTDPTKLRITVEVPAQDLRLIQAGMEGELKIASLGKTLTAKILGLSPYVDPATGTATCELSLKPKDQAALTPGLLGQVGFRAGLHQGFLISESALIYKGPDPFIRVVDAGKAKQVAVKLGRREKGMVEITDGLTEGASLIERASRYVADGEAVTVDSGEKKE